MTDARVELAPRHKQGLTVRGRLLNAAGTLGYSGEARGRVDLAALGALITNPFTLLPRTPAAAPNALPLGEGWLIHTGLPNPGLRAGLRRFGAEWGRLGLPVIVHLAATTPNEVARAMEMLERDERVHGLELGLRDDVSGDDVRQLVRAARGGPPLIVRLPVQRAAELAGRAVPEGADALTVGAPARGTAEAGGRTVTGRRYGPAEREGALAALAAVAELGFEAVPLIAAGGLYSPEDVRAALALGAAAVQLDAVLWGAPEWLRNWERGGLTAPERSSPDHR